MNREVYRAIAKKHGVTVEEVRQEIEVAIEDASKNPNFAALNVPSANGMPTPEEFIVHVAKLVQGVGEYSR